MAKIVKKIGLICENFKDFCRICLLLFLGLGRIRFF